MSLIKSTLCALLIVSAMAACSKNPPQDPANANAAIQAGKDDLKDSKGSTGAMDEAVAQADLKPVYFEYDRFNVRKNEVAKVRKVADLMQKYPSLVVKLEGHADERGSTDYNLVLGQKRADSVKELLTSYGIISERLQTHSYGEEFPAAQGDSEDAHAQNRRVEFVITAR